MLRREDGQLYFSPTDLHVFFESPYASFMNRRACDEPSAYPGERVRDPQLELAAEKGNEHEAAFLARLRGTHDVCEIPRARGDASFVATEAAIRAGREVVFQAALRHERFFGYADFLFRVDAPGTTATVIHGPTNLLSSFAPSMRAKRGTPWASECSSPYAARCCRSTLEGGW